MAQQRLRLAGRRASRSRLDHLVTRALVVMGVSGSGKSTLGRALADALRWRFIEGDTLHPQANIAKMAAGIPLDDEDRWPFLEAVARAIVEARQPGVVITCSALKRSYRDLIRERAGDVLFVLPTLERDRILARLSERQNHFMPASLLDSQLATLEAPAPDEGVIVVEGAEPTDVQLSRVLSALQLQRNEGSFDSGI